MWFGWLAVMVTLALLTFSVNLAAGAYSRSLGRSGASRRATWSPR